MILTLEDKLQKMESDEKLVKHTVYNKKEFKEPFKRFTNMTQKELFNDLNMDGTEF